MSSQSVKQQMNYYYTKRSKYLDSSSSTTSRPLSFITKEGF